MATDGNTSGSSNDVVIPITAEDKLTAVFAQMSASIDDKLGKMVDAMNRRTSSVDANFKRMADSSKQMDRIGLAVDHIDSRFNRLWKTTIGLGGAFAAFKLAQAAWSSLKSSLNDTPLGQAGGAAADAFGKAWGDVIGKLNGRFKPEIDALASAIQYLGDVAVKVVLPELGVMAQALADLFFGKLAVAGVNAQTFADNVSTNFHAMATNVVRALALIETVLQNWSTVWQIAVTSAAIKLLDFKILFGDVMNTINMIMVSASRTMQYHWEVFFEYVFAGLDTLKQAFAGVTDFSNPLATMAQVAANMVLRPPKVNVNKVKPDTSPIAPLFPTDNDRTARDSLKTDLDELMLQMFGGFDRNFDRLMKKLEMVQMGNLRPLAPLGAGGGNGGGGAGGGRNTANLWETGFLTRAGSDSYDPAMATRNAQLAELRDMKKLHIQHLKMLEEIRNHGGVKEWLKWADMKAAALGF